MAPLASLAGRNIGSDFSGKDGFSMYHGDAVPGFPSHPHRGFETVTIARRGYIDHSDSLGATARFGHGDVQWLTTGAGIVHSEMFPLVNEDKPNPTELFQIWLNLPRASKMVSPYFSMIWAEEVPTIVEGEPGQQAELRVIAGAFDATRAVAPPPDSWANRPAAHVEIWTIRLEKGAKITLPPTTAASNRTLYFFSGSAVILRGAGEELAVDRHAMLELDPSMPVELEALEDESELLLLGGEPIGEPVVQHGPFVLTTQQELEQTFHDYSRTRFGGWPWGSSGPVHPRGKGRFAVHTDGRVETRDRPEETDESSLDRAKGERPSASASNASAARPKDERIPAQTAESAVIS